MAMDYIGEMSLEDKSGSTIMIFNRNHARWSFVDSFVDLSLIRRRFVVDLSLTSLLDLKLPSYCLFSMGESNSKHDGDMTRNKAIVSCKHLQ